MQRQRIVLVTAAIACAPLGCQTVSDVFNEPPADPQRAERDERVDSDDDDDDTRTRDAGSRAARERAKRDVREGRRESRERQARRQAREDARAEQRGERQRGERGDRRLDRSRVRARDYIAASSCPARVEGTRVSMVDVVDGIALEFTAASEEDARAVQERARRLMNTQREVASARDVDDPELEALPPARVDYDIQDEGARIEFKVDSEADLRELRTQLRRRVDILKEEGECPRDFMTMLPVASGRAG